jgi:large subunit ribosomal protein L23
MTVEMEQPFVWPEIPDLEPWGKAEREKETREAIAASGSFDANEQRAAARTLREQAEMLFKKEDTTIDQVIERKKREGLALSTAEQEKEDKRLQREARLRGMSSLKLWEEKRTSKVVESDDRSKFTIKA